jgi:hypothetical protein
VDPAKPIMLRQSKDDTESKQIYSPGFNKAWGCMTERALSNSDTHTRFFNSALVSFGFGEYGTGGTTIWGKRWRSHLC